MNSHSALRRPPLEIMGWIGGPTATDPKHVCWVVTDTATGAKGDVAFTGAYWAVTSWIGELEVERVRRKAAAAKPASYLCLGTDLIGLALSTCDIKALKPASEKQAAFLVRLGMVIDGPLPALFAGEAISVLRSAADVLAGRWQPANINPAPVRDALAQLVPRYGAIADARRDLQRIKDALGWT